MAPEPPAQQLMARVGERPARGQAHQRVCEWFSGRLRGQTHGRSGLARVWLALLPHLGLAAVVVVVGDERQKQRPWRHAHASRLALANSDRRWWMDHGRRAKLPHYDSFAPSPLSAASLGWPARMQDPAPLRQSCLPPLSSLHDKAGNVAYLVIYVNRALPAAFAICI